MKESNGLIGSLKLGRKKTSGTIQSGTNLLKQIEDAILIQSDAASPPCIKL